MYMKNDRYRSARVDKFMDKRGCNFNKPTNAGFRDDTIFEGVGAFWCWTGPLHLEHNNRQIPSFSSTNGHLGAS